MTYHSPINVSSMPQVLFEEVFHKAFPQANTLTVANIMEHNIFMGLDVLATQMPANLNPSAVIPAVLRTLAKMIVATPGLELLLELENDRLLLKDWGLGQIDDPSWWRRVLARRNDMLRNKRNCMECEGLKGRKKEMDILLSHLNTVDALWEICSELERAQSPSTIWLDSERIIRAICRMQVAAQVFLGTSAAFYVGEEDLNACRAKFGKLFLSIYRQSY